MSAALIWHCPVSGIDFKLRRIHKPQYKTHRDARRTHETRPRSTNTTNAPTKKKRKLRTCAETPEASKRAPRQCPAPPGRAHTQIEEGDATVARTLPRRENANIHEGKPQARKSTVREFNENVNKHQGNLTWGGAEKPVLAWEREARFCDHGAIFWALG